MKAAASHQGRLRSAAAVAVVHATAAVLLLRGLAADPAVAVPDPLKLFEIAREDPSPPPAPEVRRRKDRTPDAAAPPGLEAEAAPVVAPEPVVPLFVPPPVIAVPIPASGSDVSLGSAAVDGRGTGSGGAGTGTGSGGAGAGSGGGEAGVPPVRTRRIRGHFTNRDYPGEAERAGAQGVVAARVTVGADGRVSSCRVRLSSGHAALDAVTCRVIRKRFRFSPARDARGAAVPDVIEWEQSWSLRPEDRPEYAEAECRTRADRVAAAPERRAAFLACMASFGWQR